MRPCTRWAVQPGGHIAIKPSKTKQSLLPFGWLDSRLGSSMWINYQALTFLGEGQLPLEHTSPISTALLVKTLVLLGRRLQALGLKTGGC